jgi:ubiquinone/menaquinone biosynthesis C-methylase UbiE
VKLPPNSIDLAFICDTYHHFEFPHKTMRSIHRALKPGGQVVLIDFHRIEGKSSEWTLGHVRAGQDVFTKEIVNAGFRQIEEKTDMLKESYFVRFQKVKDKATEESSASSPRSAPYAQAMIKTMTGSNNDGWAFRESGPNHETKTTEEARQMARRD